MTTARVHWVLGSASPRRREILDGLGLRFEIAPSPEQEPPRAARESPSAYAVRAARLKAGAVGGGRSSGMVIAADTIVVAGDHLMGKPSSRAEAERMLRRLSGRWHEVITGICLLNCRTLKLRSGHCRSRVHFRRLSTREIEWYLGTGEHRDKAGAYAIQGYASLFVDRIEGCYFNIVGFPVATFERLCRRSGIDLTTEIRHS